VLRASTDGSPGTSLRLPGSPTMYLTMEATAIASGLLDRQFGVRGGAEVTAPATKTQLILDHLLGRPTPRGA